MDPLTYGDLLHTIPEDLRKLYRKYESMEKRIIRAKWSRTLNDVCLKEHILPDFARIRHHDPALVNSSNTIEYQFSLIREEIVKKDRIVDKLCKDKEEILNLINSYEIDGHSKDLIRNALNVVFQNSNRAQKTAITKKLNKFSNSQILLKNDIDCFTNLSGHELSPLQKEYLNLGLKYHLQPKYNKLHKQTELEVLYNTLTDLEKENKITMNPRIVEQLASESTKHRNPYYKSSVSNELRNAAK